MKYIKVNGVLYRELDSSKDQLLKLAAVSRSMSKLADVAWQKQRVSIEDAFTTFEDRYAELLEKINAAAKAASNELSREARKYQKSVGIRIK